tara:strand:+ start:314 stop:817 length:504 start_codon:yes stop_codon:yes gene_type:complete
VESILSDLKLSELNHSEIQYESCNLVTIGKNIYGNGFLKLDSIAAVNFFKMKEKAAADSIEFRILSAYRSFEHQKQIINRKLNSGQSIDNILKENTLPGYSEHHTGYAIDFLEDNKNYLSVNFENTKTFKWLSKNANNYGFYMSYSKNNNHGIMYEPWHWMFKNNVD